MAKTTKKDFELFKSECEKWIEFFGLKGWQISFSYEKLSKGKAECTYNIVNRSVLLSFNKQWNTESENDKITPENIKRDAFHEVSEMLLCKLRNLAEYRFTTQYEIDEAVHEIIRTLENVVFK